MNYFKAVDCYKSSSTIFLCNAPAHQGNFSSCSYVSQLLFDVGLGAAKCSYDNIYTSSMSVVFVFFNCVNVLGSKSIHF